MHLPARHPRERCACGERTSCLPGDVPGEGVRLHLLHALSYCACGHCKTCQYVPERALYHPAAVMQSCGACCKEQTESALFHFRATSVYDGMHDMYDI